MLTSVMIWVIVICVTGGFAYFMYKFAGQGLFTRVPKPTNEDLAKYELMNSWKWQDGDIIHVDYSHDEDHANTVSNYRIDENGNEQLIGVVRFF